MNRIIYYFIGLCLPFLLAGCEKDIDTWSGQDTAFMQMNEDSTLVAFAFVDGDLDTVNIKINVIGNVFADRDRQLKVKVTATGAVEGVDYVALQDSYTIGKGRNECVIPVILKRPQTQELRKLEVELVENEYFRLLMRSDEWVGEEFSRIRHTIYYHSQMDEAPETWDDWYLGDFSVKKFETIAKVMSISKKQLTDWDYMTPGRIDFIGSYMNEYLKKNPVMEEDGSEMRMGENYNY